MDDRSRFSNKPVEKYRGPFHPQQKERPSSPHTGRFPTWCLGLHQRSGRHTCKPSGLFCPCFGCRLQGPTDARVYRGRDQTVQAGIALRMLYTALLLPTMEYCAANWCPSQQHHCERLESVQRRATRIICGRSSITSTNSCGKRRALGWCERRRTPRVRALCRVADG